MIEYLSIYLFLYKTNFNRNNDSNEKTKRQSHGSASSSSSDVKRKSALQLEVERLRISRDLHDHVGAQLSYLISNLDWIVSHPDALEKEEELKRLSNLSDTGRQAILTLRQTELLSLSGIVPFDNR